MSYRAHTAVALWTTVQHGTAAEIDANLVEFEHVEDDPQDANQRYLILNDMGNQEAWIVGGSRGTLRDLGQRILNLVNDPTIDFYDDPDDGAPAVSNPSSASDVHDA